jgi:hypothetical protein
LGFADRRRQATQSKQERCQNEETNHKTNLTVICDRHERR